MTLYVLPLAQSERGPLFRESQVRRQISSTESIFRTKVPMVGMDVQPLREKSSTATGPFA